MKRRDLRTNESTWRNDMRRRHLKKEVKPQIRISVKHVAAALVAIFTTIEVFKYVAI